MTYRARLAVLTGIAALMLPSPALAHTAQATDGFLQGLLHPVFGPDHLLAMVSVGIVSAQLGGRRVFTIPAMFVTAMIGGAAIGVQGTNWPLAEPGIALTVVVLGVLIATVTETVASWPVMLVVACFGALHGHAHGLELPKSIDPIYYAGGFVTGTSVIHLIGVGIGHVSTARARWATALRHVGSAIAGVGLSILMARLVS